MSGSGAVEGAVRDARLGALQLAADASTQILPGMTCKAFFNHFCSGDMKTMVANSQAEKDKKYGTLWRALGRVATEATLQCFELWPVDFHELFIGVVASANLDLLAKWESLAGPIR